MKKVWIYLVTGLFVAAVGVLVSDIVGDIFNGMDYGSACAVGMGMYLCVVVVTCTGIIVSKIESKSTKDNSEEKKEQ